MTSFRHGVALIVTDVQNDFADPAGGLAVAGAAAIVPGLNAAIAAARAGGALVVYTQDWHPPHTPHFAQDGGPWPVHCVAGTWGADFHPALDADGPVVRKGSNGEDGYSGFTMRDHLTGAEVPTALHDLLHAAETHTVVVGGIATDYCVRATVLDALRLGYAVTLRTDLVAAVDLRPGDGEAAIAEMVAAGARRADG